MVYGAIGILLSNNIEKRVSPSQYGGYGPRLVTKWVRIRIPSEWVPKPNEIDNLIEEVVDLARQINSKVDRGDVQELLN
ncbi:hypothetical protein TNCV_4006661 [Trichonephila clavipes]|nr:hypothetical protein TNCV_4006661 [Trichonephila clavipes]